MPFSIGVFATVFDSDGRVLCLRQDYGERFWTLPGGALESGEDPESALLREILEETGLTAVVTGFTGIYHSPYKDDLALSFRATIQGSTVLLRAGEIAEADWFATDRLPAPMTAGTRARIEDAASGRTGISRTFDTAQHERPRKGWIFTT